MTGNVLNFTWSSFISHVVPAILAYFLGLFTPPPGSKQ